MWHILDVRAIWVREFASAFCRLEPSTVCWEPDIGWAGAIQEYSRAERLDDPALEIRHFPLQQGFARFPVDILANEGNRIAKRLAAASDHPKRDILVCTSPHYAACAEAWPGPVVYYATDLFSAWGELPSRILAFERRLCRIAATVVPDSSRIAEVLTRDAACRPYKIVVLPMATRAANILAAPASAPTILPADARSLPRPVVGIIGNLANNLDWSLLREAVKRLRDFSWLFVGPTEMPVRDVHQRAARAELLNMGGRVRFVGCRPYGELAAYARAIDVAVLPYRRVEPTFSGSSTRFYEHLAACRPILATRGFHELLSKEPLLKLVGSVDELVCELRSLESTGFRDGREDLRWRTSSGETWEARAALMRKEVALRTGAPDGPMASPSPARSAHLHARGSQ